ncbi:hypothetical protein AAFF_G00069260 [Aldrovandia affinis]|uniref:Uncharacterized protein n=1 Tax=Aldrovandia affinis TaxID=143900 RepID=A0AAD7RZD8_9TELE|nr:hypothetical protein AAFF_G00069260 [Aldrovandia affinis]
MTLQLGLAEEIAGSRYLSVMIDGDTDASNKDGECQSEQVLQEWQQLKTLIRTTFADKSYLGLWQTLLTKEPYRSDFEVDTMPVDSTNKFKWRISCPGMVLARHLNSAVRKCADQHLANLVERVGATSLLSDTRDITECILPAVARLAQESSQEARMVKKYIPAKDIADLRGITQKAQVFDCIVERLQESNRKVNQHTLDALNTMIPQLKDNLAKVINILVPAIVDHLNYKINVIHSTTESALNVLIYHLDNALLLDVFLLKAQLLNGKVKEYLIFKLAGTDEDVEKLIHARIEHRAAFSGRRNAAAHGWEIVLKDIGLEGVVTPLRVAKKWENLKKHYKVFDCIVERLQESNRKVNQHALDALNTIIPQLKDSSARVINILVPAIVDHLNCKINVIHNDDIFQIL